MDTTTPPRQHAIRLVWTEAKRHTMTASWPIGRAVAEYNALCALGARPVRLYVDGSLYLKAAQA